MKLKKFDLDHEPCYWWIRSACSVDSNVVGSVYGHVYCDHVYYDGGLILACIII